VKLFASYHVLPSSSEKAKASSEHITYWIDRFIETGLVLILDFCCTMINQVVMQLKGGRTKVSF